MNYSNDLYRNIILDHIENPKNKKEKQKSKSKQKTTMNTGPEIKKRN